MVKEKEIISKWDDKGHHILVKHAGKKQGLKRPNSRPPR
jgi:hypothetical protein